MKRMALIFIAGCGLSAVAAQATWAQSAVVNIQANNPSPVATGGSVQSLTPYANYLLIGQLEDIPGGGGARGFYATTGAVPLTFFAKADDLKSAVASMENSNTALANASANATLYSQQLAAASALIANSGQAAAAAANAAAALDRVERRYDRLDRKLTAGVAVAGIMDIAMPGPGASNRIGTSVSTFRSTQAFSLSSSHRAGAVDFGFAVGAASGAGMGKASVGLSW